MAPCNNTVARFVWAPPRFPKISVVLTLLINLAAATLNTSRTAWTLLYQNNLNISDDTNHIGALLTSPLTYQDGLDACSSASEKPIKWDLLQAHQDDFLTTFNYLCYSGRLSCPQALWIDDGILVVGPNATTLGPPKMLSLAGSRAELSQLCTQSSSGSMGYDSFASPNNLVSIHSSNTDNDHVGYRNQKSFRFLGVRFADKPERFAHSKATTVKSQTSNNTVYGVSCMQDGSGAMSEDCLFMNIHTPYLLGATPSNTSGRPVLFYIHGGALVVGSANSWTSDGSSLAAREDLVVTSLNYRLGTYGFLTVPGTQCEGNYGLGDVITALKWVQANIAIFGGDPSQVTILGDSAGAALVRALVGSPEAGGLFHGAIAMSNLGGALEDLDQSDGDYGTPNTFYYNASQSFSKAGRAILGLAGCDTGANLASRLSCLISSKTALNKLATQAQWLVQDGKYLTQPYLDVGKSNGIPNKVPLITGVTANDGASFVTRSTSCKNMTSCLYSNLGVPYAAAQSIVDSNLFPSSNTGDLASDAFNVSQRVRTDDTFRCVDQATAYAAAKSKSLPKVWYYQNDRGNGGFNPAGVPDGSAGNGPNDPPYYRLHSSDMLYAFGNLANVHGAPDLRASRLLSAYWGSFARTGDPNPDPGLLKIRGYMDTYRTVTGVGRWEPVVGEEGPMMVLDDPPAVHAGFMDMQQCSWLNYSLNYFMD